jgi:predicted phosphodiesterase
LPALEAVLEEIRGVRPDLLVIGGDVVPGPMPRECLAVLLGLNLPTRFIQGNGDRTALAQIRGEEVSGVPEQLREVIQWTAQEIAPDYEAVLAGWGKTLRLRVEGIGEVLFCHATPRNDTEIFTRETAEARLLPIFDGLGIPVVVCGHTHMPFDRRVGSTRVVNAGSVGMPYGEPGAYWLMLGPGVEPRHTAYDLAAAAERVRATRYPMAEEFASGNVLAPPSIAERLAAFSRAELG